MTQTSTQQHPGPSPQTLESIRSFARTYQPCHSDRRVVVLHTENPLRSVGGC